MINPKELTGHQRIAYKNIKHCAEQYIGGLINTLSDCDEDDSYYINADQALKDHEGLCATVYSEALNGEYGVGYAGCRPVKEMRLCGKEWLNECVDYVVRAEGY